MSEGGFAYDLADIRHEDTALMARMDDGRGQPDSLALMHDYLISDARADLLRDHRESYVVRANEALARTMVDKHGNVRRDSHLGDSNKWRGEAHRIDLLLDRQVQLRVIAAFN